MPPSYATPRSVYNCLNSERAFRVMKKQAYWQAMEIFLLKSMREREEYGPMKNEPWNKYWKYNPAGRPPVSDRYPKPLSYWSGIPADGVDSVVQYVNGYTYFFKDGKYWRFNDGKFEVDAADPPYPRDVAAWWFGCDKGQLKMQGDRADILPDTADHQGSLMDAEGRSPSSKNMGARNCMTPLFILSATLLKSGLSDLLNMGF
ncbi:unnamed protein product [Darwinula stevensoni]|uniref:Uncharacterized protein n=1 Tax=Darwinula stevensoni TaxID=69355 RepID=A0A7R8X2I4_9CRUS|nr:unnamed protein product [Darwinula stevensoni]CAG0883963.1 unnamed protein product [Darwinula stevensoni]